MASQIEKKEVAERIHEANSILIITSGDPEIDQLSACISLFDILQTLDKKAVMVYSGLVNTALNFLKPDKIIREDAESLRDFIISFDRSKVDKFRYTQEGDQYNILLTPAHRAIITEKDMKYRKGDFNIDLTIALGVAGKDKIDSTISQHNQLMKEIPMISILAGKGSGNLDAMIWKDEARVALCEMMFDLCQTLDDKLKVEKQTANAMLMGIVDRTERYKSRRTKAETMHISGELLDLGADPHLVAENLALAGSTPADLPEAEASSTKEMVEEAVGEAGDYDTQRIKGKRQKKSGRSQRLYIRASDEAALAYGKKEEKGDEDDEHKLDQLSIDSEGNLHIIEEDDNGDDAAGSNDGNGGGNAEAPADKAPAAAQADDATKPAAAAAALSASGSDAGTPELANPAASPADKGRKNVLTPTSNIQAANPVTGAASPPPTAAALSTPAPPLTPPAPLAGPSPPAPAAAPPLDVSPTALALAKGTAPPPTAANAKSNQMHQYIDSLSSAANAAAQPTPPANAGPPASPTAAGQALTVNNYLAQQQPAPPPAPAAAPPLVTPPPANATGQPPPPAAPPLPSVG